jgi:hypothetical protein
MRQLPAAKHLQSCSSAQLALQQQLLLLVLRLPLLPETVQMVLVVLLTACHYGPYHNHLTSRVRPATPPAAVVSLVTTTSAAAAAATLMAARLVGSWHRAAAASALQQQLWLLAQLQLVLLRQPCGVV